MILSTKEYGENSNQVLVVINIKIHHRPVFGDIAQADADFGPKCPLFRGRAKRAQVFFYLVDAPLSAVHRIIRVFAEFDGALDQEIEDRDEIVRRVGRDLNTVGHSPPVVRRSWC